MAKPWLSIAAVALLAVVVYAPSLSGGFVWDDRALIEQDEQIHNLGNAPRYFTRDFFAPGQDDSEYGYYRPLVSLSYAVDWAIWRDDPFGYRLTNLLWHAAATVLLFLLARRLAGGSTWAAALAAAIFAAHPIHTESVAWIAGRTDVICGALSLGALLAWERYREAGRGLWLAGVLFFAALLAKEMAVAVLPAAAALAYFGQATKRESKAKTAGALAWAAGALAIYLVLRVGLAHVTADTPPAEHGLWRAAMTFPAAFALYVGKLVLPVGLSAYIVLPYADHPFTPLGLAGLALLALCGAAIWSSRRRAPMAAAMGLAFIASFAPLANFVRLSAPSDMGFVVAERFLYFPSMFLCLALAAAAANWRPRKSAVAVATAIVALFAAQTVFAARVWTDEIGVYEHALAGTPEAPLLWANLGAAYRRADRLDDALDALQRAVEVNARTHSADATAIYNNLGTTLATRGQLEDALAAFDRALATGKQTDRVQFNRGEALRLLGRPAEALAAYDAALAGNADYLDPRLRRAELNMSRRHTAEAAADLREVLRRDAGNAEALAGLGHVARREGRLAEAADDFEKSLGRRPDDVNTLMALGGVRGQMGNFRGAAAAFGRVREVAPDYATAYAALAAALFRGGDRSGASEILRDASARFPDNVDVLLAQLNFDYESGDRDAARASLERLMKLAPDHPQVRRYAAELMGAP